MARRGWLRFYLKIYTKLPPRPTTSYVASRASSGTTYLNCKYRIKSLTLEVSTWPAVLLHIQGEDERRIIAALIARPPDTERVTDLYLSDPPEHGFWALCLC